MKLIHTILIALVALAFGAVGGYLLGGQAASPPIVWQEPVTDEPLPEAEAPLPQQQVSQKVARIENMAPVEATKHVGGADVFDAWIAQFADSVPDAGTGRIFGQVLLKEGTPVEGVTVTAVPNRRSQPSYSPDPSIRESLENYARYVHFSRTGRREAVTGADGRYEFTGLGDYEYSVNARADAYEVRSAGGYSGRIRPDAEVNFSAQLMCVVKLDLRMPDGSQPEKANVTFRRGNNTRGISWSPSGQPLQMEPGTYSMDISVGDDREFTSEPETVELTFESSPFERTVQLSRGVGISCDVKFPAVYTAGAGGSWRYDLKITLVTDPPPEPPTTVQGEEAPDARMWSRQTTTFPRLNPGRYRLIASADGLILAWKDVNLGSAFLKETLEVPEPSAADFISMRVLAPDGTPIRDADVQVHAPGLRSHGRFNVLRPEDGSYWLRRANPTAAELRGSDKWSYTITVRSDKFGETRAEYPSDGTHTLEVRYAAPCTLTVVIPGAADHPLKERLSAQLSLVQKNGFSGVSPQSRPSGGGLPSEPLKYGPLAPGKYRFVISGSAAGERRFYQRTEIAEWEFELTGGEVTQTCPIPQTCTLTLLIDDPKAVRYIGLRRTDGKPSTSISLQANRISERTVVEFLTPGEWIVNTSDGQMRVQVSGDREVRLDLLRFNCFRLTVTENGRIHELGLRNGDLLIAVDGQEFETTDDLHKQAQFSYTQESTTWTVLRNGAAVPVTFNGRQAQKIMNDHSTEREYIRMSPAVRE